MSALGQTQGAGPCLLHSKGGGWGQGLSWWTSLELDTAVCQVGVHFFFKLSRDSPQGLGLLMVLTPAVHVL